LSPYSSILVIIQLIQIFLIRFFVVFELGSFLFQTCRIPLAAIVALCTIVRFAVRAIIWAVAMSLSLSQHALNGLPRTYTWKILAIPLTVLEWVLKTFDFILSVALLLASVLDYTLVALSYVGGAFSALFSAAWCVLEVFTYLVNSIVVLVQRAPKWTYVPIGLFLLALSYKLSLNLTKLNNYQQISGPYFFLLAELADGWTKILVDLCQLLLSILLDYEIGRYIGVDRLMERLPFAKALCWLPWLGRYVGVDRHMERLSFAKALHLLSWLGRMIKRWL
jgi:hypothetical protein